MFPGSLAQLIGIGEAHGEIGLDHRNQFADAGLAKSTQALHQFIYPKSIDLMGLHWFGVWENIRLICFILASLRAFGNSLEATSRRFRDAFSDQLLILAKVIGRMT